MVQFPPLRNQIKPSIHLPLILVFKIKNTKKSQAIAHYAKTHFLFSKISGKFRSIQSISTDNFSAA